MLSVNRITLEFDYSQIIAGHSRYVDKSALRSLGFEGWPAGSLTSSWLGIAEET